MINSFKKFREIINDTKNSGVIYVYLANIVKPPYDYSDLLRWQLAQAVSALDKLIHDLVRVGMLEIYTGRRVPTAKYRTFALTLETVGKMKSDPTNELSYVEQQIALTNGFKSFQDPDKIAESLSSIWDEPKKWEKIALGLGTSASALKAELKNIVIRRNQIVHAGDYNGFLPTRETIIESDVAFVVSFIDKLGGAIYDCVR